MEVSSVLLGWRDFYSKNEIIQFATNSKNFNKNSENLGRAKALLMFGTSKQHTWLVATNERLYCILDDVRKDRPHINWSMSKSDLVDIRVGEVTIDLRTRERSSQTGLLDIGPRHRNWLYSKKLFRGSDLTSEVQMLISDSMLVS